jgi:hypothetical protein
MVWGKIYSNTVSVDDQSFDTGTVSTSKLIDIIFSQNGHTGNSLMRFNGDTGSNYAERFDVNGGGDNVRQSGTSNINVLTAGTGDVQTLTFLNMVNISGEEKLSVYDTIYTNATGAGTAPLRVRGVSKWANTSAQITQTTVTDSGNGFDTGSNLSVLGSDITPAIVTPAIPAIPSLMPNLPSGSVGGWVELGRTSNASLPDVTGLADKRYLMFLNFQESNNSRPAPAIIINGDTGSNYARRGNANGLTDYTNVNQPQIMFGGQPEGNTTTVPYFTVGYIANKSDKEKLAICHNTLSYQLGASGSDPLERRDTVFKWTNTSEPIDQLTITNFLSGSFTTNGELIVLGWDPTDTHTTNFWEELASVTLGTDGDVLSSGTISAKKYLWVQAFIKNSGDTARFNTQVTFNDDTSNNYAMRRSFDGGSDSTSTSASNLFSSGVTGSNDDLWCMNLFILNNASNEKLCIAHGFDTYIGSGAGNAPSQRYEAVGKWTNTHNQITKIDITNTDTSNYDAISELRVWGSD